MGQGISLTADSELRSPHEREKSQMLCNLAVTGEPSSETLKCRFNQTPLGKGTRNSDLHSSSSE